LKKNNPTTKISATSTLLISNSYNINTKKSYCASVNTVPKKRHISIWLLPIIAIIGVIGYLMIIIGKPKPIQIRQKQLLKKKSTPTYNFEMRVISDLDQVQVNAL
jgi:hypothetical protein